MARPRSDDRRNAILAAAVRVIAVQGTGAPTALIAKAADVSNGSLFTYFETKTELFNQLYVELKTEVGAVALRDFPHESSLCEQLRHVWTQWLHWATAHPNKRRVLAHLGVSDDITPSSRQAGGNALAGLGKLVDRCRSDGPMHDAPLPLVVTVMNGVAEATMDLMMRDPANADAHCATAFQAVWRMIA